jgi:hypothetical protein
MMTNDFRFAEFETDDFSDFEPALSAGSSFDPSQESIHVPLNRVPPGLWTSRGGYLDYTQWPERERFAELDRVLEAEGKSKTERRLAPARVMRRCRAKVNGLSNCNELFMLVDGYRGWKCEAHRVVEANDPPEPDWMSYLSMAPGTLELAAPNASL